MRRPRANSAACFEHKGFTLAAVVRPGTERPALLYGPGDASMAHQPDEFVPLEKLEEAARFYAAMIERYLID